MKCNKVYYVIGQLREQRQVQNIEKVNDIIIHSKYFPVSDWLKPHA